MASTTAPSMISLAGFHRAMQSIGISENVMAFTMSDFGRTFKGNAQNGTDHAWGSNHLVGGMSRRAGSSAPIPIR